MVTAAVPPAVPALQQQQPQQQRGCHAGFTHLDAAGRLPTMVDVGDKAVTTRTARARSKVILPRDVLHALVGSESNQGDGGTITELSGPKVRAVVVARVLGEAAVTLFVPRRAPFLRLPSSRASWQRRRRAS